MDKIGDALFSTTGIRLTGAALLTYVILSEGSRLFPPRNAVPIP
ncbi:hypothetical protein [Burkholderia glumae]|nr:hypothetical protein [Burkholderia glumae]